MTSQPSIKGTIVATHAEVLQKYLARSQLDPKLLCWTSRGFCNRMAEEHGSPDLWYWERPQPDVVHFRMNREV